MVRCARTSLAGDWRYHLWLLFLAVVILLGVNAYAKQFVHGLVVTGMNDHVSWGVYIANFTFLVGIASSSVMLVIPVYIYKNKELEDLVLFGQLLAVVAILMSLAFVMVDLGRPLRSWHMIPGPGKLNFPQSLLSWDVLVLNGYLLLNLYLCGYLLHCRYRHQSPVRWRYLPIIYLGIGWAICIQMVEAFLFVGLGGRPFWNTAILGPRFIASAFTAGPAIIILAMQIVRRVTATLPQGREWAKGEPVTAGRPARRQDLEELDRFMPEMLEVSPAVRDEVLEGTRVLEAEHGEVLLRQGDLGREAYFVLEGRVVIERTESGLRRIVGSVGRGEPFGEISALSNTPRTATATADGRARVLCLPVESLRRLMRSSSSVDRVIRSRMADRLRISDRALLTLRGIVQVAMVINVFLLLNELFKEFYSGTLHVASSKYLYFGLDGHHALVPWIWTAIVCNLAALVLLLLPLSRGLRALNVACVLAVFGIWVEKGMGMVVPAFIPTPLGEIVEYTPSLNETLICLGIWALGLLCYSMMLRVAIPILQGRLFAGDAPIQAARPGLHLQPATKPCPSD